MREIPQARTLDATIPFLSSGYPYITRQCRRYGSDAFLTRLMLRKTLCVVGEDGARMFFHPDRFTRRGAVPPTAMLLLQDLGSVQSLQGTAHRHRKAMFMNLMSPAGIQKLVDLFRNEWLARIPGWKKCDRLVLHFEVEEILCKAAFLWCGLPINNVDLQARTREYRAMIEGAGAVGPRNWRGLWLRNRSERWARRLIEDIRADAREIPRDAAASIVAHHQDENGKVLPTKIAAIELLNLLRPIVAVARFITFAALALHEHPREREQLQAGRSEEALEFFVQEVRRYYPFFPVLAGIACEDFEWRSQTFRKGLMVVLDLYGTNHDPRIWQDAEAFRPNRFQHWDESPYNFIPQGGGDLRSGHRCPGERITIELIKESVRLLLSMDYVVPAQDLEVDLARLPSIPQSRFIISNVSTA